MPPRKTVLVLESEKLLTDGVYSILSSHPEFVVACVPFTELGMLDAPEHIEPDVVIMDQELVANNISAVMHLIDRHPKVRLIVLGVNNNVLHIFDKYVVNVASVSQFIEQL